MTHQRPGGEPVRSDLSGRQSPGACPYQSTDTRKELSMSKTITVETTEVPITTGDVVPKVITDAVTAKVALLANETAKDLAVKAGEVAHSLTGSAQALTGSATELSRKASKASRAQVRLLEKSLKTAVEKNRPKAEALAALGKAEAAETLSTVAKTASEQAAKAA